MRRGLIVCLLIAGCDSAVPDVHQTAGARRGTFKRIVILTGELAAARRVDLRVPDTGEDIPLSWLIADGTRVEAGDRIVEFSKTDYARALATAELAVEAARRDVAEQVRKGRLKMSDQQNSVRLAELERDKAKLSASVDPALVTGRDYQERTLALERAEINLAQARAKLRRSRQTSHLELETQTIELQEARRELAAAKRIIDRLTLRAPIAGVVTTGTHPWTDKKFFAGDEVRSGWVIASMPDMTKLIVHAKLSDVDDGDVSAGMPVKVYFEAAPGRVIDAVVTDVSALAGEVDSTSRRRAFNVTVALNNNEGDKQRAWVRPGMSARVEVETTSINNALVIPRASVTWSHRGARLIPSPSILACNPRVCAVQDNRFDGADGNRDAPQ